MGKEEMPVSAKLQTSPKRIGRPPISRTKQAINIVMPDDLMDQLRMVTDQRMTTIARYVRRAIEEKLEKEKR
jgi:hypothetical protein